jgi:hypothetical protein
VQARWFSVSVVPMGACGVGYLFAYYERVFYKIMKEHTFRSCYKSYRVCARELQLSLCQKVVLLSLMCFVAAVVGDHLQ